MNKAAAQGAEVRRIDAHQAQEAELAGLCGGAPALIQQLYAIKRGQVQLLPERTPPVRSRVLPLDAAVGSLTQLNAAHHRVLVRHRGQLLRHFQTAVPRTGLARPELRGNAPRAGTAFRVFLWFDARRAIDVLTVAASDELDNERFRRALLCCEDRREDDAVVVRDRGTVPEPEPADKTPLVDIAEVHGHAAYHQPAPAAEAVPGLPGGLGEGAERLGVVAHRRDYPRAVPKLDLAADLGAGRSRVEALEQILVDRIRLAAGGLCLGTARQREIRRRRQQPPIIGDIDQTSGAGSVEQLRVLQRDLLGLGGLLVQQRHTMGQLPKLPGEQDAKRDHQQQGEDRPHEARKSSAIRPKTRVDRSGCDRLRPRRMTPRISSLLRASQHR